MPSNQADLNAVFYPWYRGRDKRKQIAQINMLAKLTVAAETGVASDAFKAVRKHFEQSSGLDDQEKSLVAGASHMEDIHRIVTESLAKYEAKSDASKTRKWLQRASETICHYGTVLDVFVQHHPEYVSLVWGTMKLLFVSVENHAGTLKLLAKSISQVAVRLPRIEIQSMLYPTEHMKLAVEDLYSYILEFLLMAHEWCNESRFRHFYHSFTQPPALRYDDLLGRISDCSKNINELAAVGSQTEIHVMHETSARKLDDIISMLETRDKDRKSQLDGLICVASKLEASHREKEKKLDRIVSQLSGLGLMVNDLLVKIETYHSIQTSMQLDTNQELSEIQLSQVLSTFSLAFEDPDKCFEDCLFLRKRRASGIGASTSTNKFWLSPKLARCSSSHESTMIIIRGTFTSRLALQDFGVDAIQALAASGIPTIWALTSVGKSRSSSLWTATDLMKYLTYQALKLGGAVRTEKQMALRYSQFHTSRTRREWLALLKQVVANIGQQVYLVVDLATVRSSLEDVDEFDLIEELRRILGEMSICVKIILLVYEADWFRRFPSEISESIVSVRTAGLKRPQGKAMRHAVNTRVFPARKRPRKEK